MVHCATVTGTDLPRLPFRTAGTRVTVVGNRGPTVDAVGAGTEEVSAGDTDLGPIATFVRFGLIGATVGLAFLIVTNGLFVRVAMAWIIAPFLLAYIAAMATAERRRHAGDARSALALATGGNWLIAAAVTAVLPFLWPVMAITVLMPLVLVTSYLRRRALVVVLSLGAAVAGGVATLGLLNDDGGAVPDIADDFEVTLVVASMMAQILPVTLVVWEMNDLHRRNLAESRTLNRELRASEAQLAVSRRRVVDAADAERRRIERNLHDGAQQRLVALGVRLRLLEDRVSGDPELADAVGSLVLDLEDAVDEVRELAHGIYPPLLRSQGLGPALGAVARRSPSPVETEVAVSERPDESIETALYFTALEALTNAAKHAPGANVLLRLDTTGDKVVLEVADEGPGFEVAGLASRSHGLSNMEDRLAAVEGRLTIDSEAGRGTTITAIVPTGPGTTTP